MGSWRDVMNELQTRIKELREQIPKWIPIKERLPEDGQVVLVTIYEDLEIGVFQMDKRYNMRVFQTQLYDIYEDDKLWPEIKAWMPAPDAYKAGEADGEQ